MADTQNATALQDIPLTTPVYTAEEVDGKIVAPPVTSVNGHTGAVNLTGNDILPHGVDGEPTVTQRLYELERNFRRISYVMRNALTASAQLTDRAVNAVAPLADNTEAIVLTFPDAEANNLARDFLVLVTNTAGNTGSITFTPPTGAVVYGDGFTNSPASGETWLYAITEVAANTFWVKSEKMEVAS